MNRLRTLASGCLLALALGPVASTHLSALETPLVLPAGPNAGIIDPGLGIVTTVEFTDAGSIRKGFANFLFDLDQLEKRVPPGGDRPDDLFTYLRTGSPKIRPTATEFQELYPDKPTKVQAEAGQKDLRSQVREAEKTWWATPRNYDGIVRGAYNCEYLMLAFPAKRAVLFYKNTGKETVEYYGSHNYSPLLYVQTAWKSNPNPSQLAKSLNLDEEEKKALEGALASRADGGAPAAAKSDLWCTIAGGAFVIVDSANNKIWSYEIKGATIEVTSVRSLAVDLLIPGFNTAPGDQIAVDTFARLYGKDIAALGVDKLDLPYIKSFVNASRVGDSAKAGALQANTARDAVLLNFTALDKLLSYQYRPGAGLELKSIRDTTVDQGLALFARAMQEKALARTALNDAGKSTKELSNCLRLTTYALTIDPLLHTEADKNSSLKNALKADWDKLMADAVKAEEELIKKREAILAAAVAERERLKAKKSKSK